jgi:hypothetical protein
LALAVVREPLRDRWRLRTVPSCVQPAICPAFRGVQFQADVLADFRHEFPSTAPTWATAHTFHAAQPSPDRPDGAMIAATAPERWTDRPVRILDLSP